jgi:hypothetical protein
LIHAAASTLELYSCLNIMRRLIRLGIVLAFITAGVSLLGALLLSKDPGSEFWSNYLLNSAAELFGLAIAATVASIIAKQNWTIGYLH